MMSMSRKKCCVPGCWESGRSHKTLHPFPNPEAERDRFNSWVYAIGGNITSLDNDFIFKQRRVCRAHFEEKYLCRSDRISNIALPTLNLPGFMNMSRSLQVARRPLGSIQYTPEPLPSTSSDLQYNFHLFEDEAKENIAPVPFMVDEAEAKDQKLDVGDDIKNSTSTVCTVNQGPVSTSAEKRIVKIRDKKILPEDCRKTADLLLFFDNLFDSINGSHSRKTEAYGKPLLGSATPNSCHVKFWKEAKKQIHDMNFINKLSGKLENVPTLKNWVWTLDGILVLLNNLKNLYNITSVWMRHLNQDPLENFFGAIRSHGCRNTNPTPDRFSSAYTTLIINNMSSVHAPGANCEKDMCENLKSFISFEGEDCKTTLACVLNEIPDVEIIDLVNKNDPRFIGPLQYVTGYFGRNLKKNVFKNCKICNNDIISTEPIEYIKYREYTGQQWLCSPTKSLLVAMSAIQDINYSILKTNLHKDCLKEFIKTIILIHLHFEFLKCTEHKNQIIDYLLEHTTNFFIFSHCKLINSIITGRREPDDESDNFQNKAKKY